MSLEVPSIYEREVATIIYFLMLTIVLSLGFFKCPMSFNIMKKNQMALQTHMAYGSDFGSRLFNTTFKKFLLLMAVGDGVFFPSD